MFEHEQQKLDFHIPRQIQTRESLTVPEHIADENFVILDSPELRTEYVRLTDRLIAKIDEENTDVIIFLDKSARPVAWLMQELWPVLGPREQNGKVKPMPSIKFLNIDREQWGAIVGRSEDAEGGIDVQRIPQERINELRSIFTTDVVSPVDAPDSTTLLDDKNVLVVDEVRASGDTLSISQGVLNRAFPDMQRLRGFHWMGGDVKYDPKSGGRRVTQLPVWYSDRDKTGRGVADRDVTKSSQSPSLRQQNGRYWLSTRFRNGIDEKGDQLRRECAWLAQEVIHHQIPYLPAPQWDTDVMVNRIEELNDMNVRQFTQLRHESEVKHTSFTESYRRALAMRAIHHSK